MNGVFLLCVDQKASRNAQAKDHRGSSYNLIGFLRLHAMFAHSFFHEAKDEIHHKGKKRNQQAADHRHCPIICRNAPVNRNAQATRSDKRRNTRKGNGHGHHIADSRHNHGHRQGKFYPKQNLNSCTSHTFCRF